MWPFWFVHASSLVVENDEIIGNFLEKFAIVSKNEHDSYYVKAKNQKQDLNLLHDLVVRSD
ncbi:MAG: aspartate kinase, partial [Thomasclavelia ramosa]